MALRMTRAELIHEASKPMKCGKCGGALWPSPAGGLCKHCTFGAAVQPLAKALRIWRSRHAGNDPVRIRAGRPFAELDTFQK